MKYLLDSSAWLAHLFDEPGVAEVTALFDDSKNNITISVLSLPEIYGRLKALGHEAQWLTVWKTYEYLFDNVFPVSRTIAHQAITLRNKIPSRLPTIDGLIAATAMEQQSILVHRDPHFSTIPITLLPQIRLPQK
jgi:predicted nucleic acid-binding protein